MSSTANNTLERFRAAASALAQLPTDSAAFSGLTEPDLLEVNQLFASSQLALRSGGALIAGEIAHRSTPDLGSKGLAQRSGHRTPQQFVKATTGVTARDAGTAVRMGVLMREAAVEGEVDLGTGEIARSSQPWLAPVTDALARREISIQAADAIRTGLGAPDSVVSECQLLDAATELAKLARSLDPDAVAREAQAARDELDSAGVARREWELHLKRSVRMFPQPDGMTKLMWLMGPETAAVVRDVYDRSTSPKLGGVRFVDPERQARADSILNDERTAEQLASDAFEQLLKLGADADPRFMLGSGAPVIRLTATRGAFERGVGLARIEGQVTPVSISSAWRLGCEAGIRGFILDDQGLVLDFGREQRFFTRNQREALSLMWGGCAAPGCDRPPSWCEAHHIVFWARDGGRTDLSDGVLLCRHHHLLFHDNGWEIKRDLESRYWLIPPPEQDPNQAPIELVPKSRVTRDLRREALIP